MLVTTAALLFIALPDANAFNARVEQIFVANDALTGASELRLLEVLAQSGTAFSEVLSSYRIIIFILLIFATALLIAALVFLVMIIALNRRMTEIQRSGIEVRSLRILRAENAVMLNDMAFSLTPAAIETLAALANQAVIRAALEHHFWRADLRVRLEHCVAIGKMEQRLFVIHGQQRQIDMRQHAAIRRPRLFR